MSVSAAASFSTHPTVTHESSRAANPFSWQIWTQDCHLGGSCTEVKYQDQLKSQTETPQSSRKSLSFSPFPKITVSSQLRPTSEDFAAHLLGWQAGHIFWLKDKQTLRVLPPRLCRAPDAAVCQGTTAKPSGGHWKPQRATAQLGGWVWGSLSVEQLVALVGKYLDLRWPD